MMLNSTLKMMFDYTLKAMCVNTMFNYALKRMCVNMMSNYTLP